MALLSGACDQIEQERSNGRACRDGMFRSQAVHAAIGIRYDSPTFACDENASGFAGRDLLRELASSHNH